MKRAAVVTDITTGTCEVSVSGEKSYIEYRVCLETMDSPRMSCSFAVPSAEVGQYTIGARFAVTIEEAV